MSEEEMMMAVRIGMELALKAASEGFKILIAGEMGNRQHVGRNCDAGGTNGLARHRT